MCATCGCGQSDHDHGHDHHHDHRHDHDDHVHGHDHDRVHEHDAKRIVRLEQDLLAKNAAFARDNRAWLAARRILALNLVSAPGSGKTTLIEKTVRALGDVPVTVVEGDQETERDADRVRAAGARAVQINTGTGCHLDAHAVGHALEDLAPPAGALLFVENVGNLVCPALFDLGEQAKVVLLSTPEGDDKPIKYPHMFRASRALVVSKIDLAPHVDFDLDRCVAFARRVNPEIEVFPISAKTGEGLDRWCAWLRTRLAAARQATS